MEEALQNTLVLIARDLHFIKWMLIALMAVFTVGVGVVVFLIVAFKKYNYGELNQHSFRNLANSLLDQNDLDAVIEISRRKLEQFF